VYQELSSIAVDSSGQEVNPHGVKTPEGIGPEHELIRNKRAANAWLLLIYLYNLRVLHHALIMDIALLLAHHNKGDAAPISAAKDRMETGVRMSEAEAELLLLMVDHCGTQLRSDDPVTLKLVVNTVNRCRRSTQAEGTGDRSVIHEAMEEQVPGGRLGYLLSALSDLRDNRSRRTQAVHADTVKRLRKWLGGVKSGMGGKAADLCLRATLQDILSAGSRGRWWRAGAKWEGAIDGRREGGSEGEMLKAEESEEGPKQGVGGEGAALLALAGRLKMNTGVRRGIFLVMMSSRDVADAFERLGRLDLRGEQDREVVRVAVECCGQERRYNAFYAELLSLFCQTNRQHRSTCQYAFWDVFRQVDKSIEAGEGTSGSAYLGGGGMGVKIPARRLVNLARLLAHLICRFHLSLSVLKPLDMAALNDDLQLFVATLFLALFTFKVITGSRTTSVSLLLQISM